ncbi:adenylate/guanylate cyclase domain-containing protein [Maribacter antarcticus]|uniref:adenylate/guanylate cyclase domain-containing protein n=1 Tax=Maribacter antarcticus TaxID=505250 RepID=UPI00047965BA|nr:adenylate/guanylate cyclase domain-containing protein [Maribacter antarcticus]
MNQKSNSLWTRALKNVLQKDKESISLLAQSAALLKVDFLVVDATNRVLWGTVSKEHTYSVEIICDSLSLGIFKSTTKAGKYIFDLIKIFLSKEFEKKSIGKEVLSLYREINMIYDLSEMISEKIDTISIAEIALRESSQIIGSTHGLFLMYDPDEDKVTELASFGDNPNSQKNIKDQNEVLKALILRGSAAIVPENRIKDNLPIQHLKAVMYAPLKVKHRTLGMVILGHEEKKEFTAAELKLLTTITLQSASAIESAHLYQKGLKEANDREEAIREIHEVSQKFVPSEFLKSLGKDNITEVRLGDLVEREVTVVFADIREFTAVSEKMSPKENFLFVNAFNNKMGPIIRKNNGFILQYLGDGFMALFPKGSQNAITASVEMQKELHDYNTERKAKSRLPIKVGVGMQNGKLIMGITGDIKRLDAAIISDTVNTAARVEGLSKHYGTSILLTKECKDDLTHPDEFDFRYLGPVQLKGKQNSIDLYECINGDTELLFNHKLNTLSTFNEAMNLFFNKEFAMAAVTFQQIFKMNTDDQTSKLFLNKSAHLITQEIEENWKGVELMNTK